MAKQSTIVHARYDAKNCKNYHLKLVYNTDMDIIEKLASVPSMQGYIKQLIRDDIANQKNGSVNIRLSTASLDALNEKAAETGKTVEGLIVTATLESLIRI